MEASQQTARVTSTKTASRHSANCDIIEPTTFRLRVETHPSSRYQLDPFWLLRSAGSSSQCGPDLPCYGRGNDQQNDQANNGRTLDCPSCRMFLGIPPSDRPGSGPGSPRVGSAPAGLESKPAQPISLIIPPVPLQPPDKPGHRA
jgi:hypothetical protein